MLQVLAITNTKHGDLLQIQNKTPAKPEKQIYVYIEVQYCISFGG